MYSDDLSLTDCLRWSEGDFILCVLPRATNATCQPFMSFMCVRLAHDCRRDVRTALFHQPRSLFFWGALYIRLPELKTSAVASKHSVHLLSILTPPKLFMFVVREHRCIPVCI